MIDPESLTTKSLVRLIDYTLLKPEETLDSYTRFLKKAGRWGFRAVMVPPCYVPLASGMLSATDVQIGAPVSFPFGYSSPEAKAAEAMSLLEEGARELDVVMNYSAARSGEWDLVREDLEEVVKAVRGWERITLGGPVILKVILETPRLDNQQKVTACQIACEVGMDYVKTATGFGPGGATVEDIELMREVVGDRVGVKASGGIKTWADMRAMIAAGASRIGTSAGPEIVEDFLNARKT
jgi:deoxyribose-phosphate aldolase